jgi:hypothetical protein
VQNSPLPSVGFFFGESEVRVRQRPFFSYKFATLPPPKKKPTFLPQTALQFQSNFEAQFEKYGTFKAHAEQEMMKEIADVSSFFGLPASDNFPCPSS